MGKRNNLDNVLRFAKILSDEIKLRFGDYPTIKDILFHLSQNGTIKPVALRNYLIDICWHLDRWFYPIQI